MNVNSSKLLELLEKELSELIEKTEIDILALENNPDKEIMNSIFRNIHTIKGNSGMAGMKNLESLSHSLETILSKLRSDLSILSTEMFDLILLAIDKLKEIIYDLDKESSTDISELKFQLDGLLEKKSENEGKKSLPEKNLSDFPMDTYIKEAKSEGKNLFLLKLNIGTQPHATIKTLLEDLKKISEHILYKKINYKNLSVLEELQEPFDFFIDVVFCTFLTPEDFKSSFNFEIRNIKFFHSVIRPSIKQEENEVVKKSNKYLKIDSSIMDEMIQLSTEAVIYRNQVVRSLNLEEDSEEDIIVSKLSRIILYLNQKLINTRLLKFDSIFNRLQRVTRDLSAQLNKKVQLKFEGSEVELDGILIESFTDCLIHMIRNSLDHGLESEKERISLGKTAVGQILVRAYLKSGNVHIEIKDDGKGLNLKKIKSKAIEKKLISQETLDKMSDNEISELIFYPGFSTSDKVSEISGRGVGMDVVITTIKSFGGKVRIESLEGKGTLFTIIIPQILSAMTVVIFSINGEKYAILQKYIMELVNHTKVKIENIDDKSALKFRDSIIPVVILEKLLYPDTHIELEKSEIIAILNSNDKIFAITFEQFLSIEDVVFKPFPPQIKNINFFSGVTILGDGSIVPIIEPDEILNFAKLEIDIEFKKDLNRNNKIHKSKKRYIIIESSSQLFILDASNVKSVKRISFSDITSVLETEMVKIEEDLIPTLRLENLFQINQLPGEEKMYCIVFDSDNQLYGLITHDLVDVIEEIKLIDSENIRDTKIEKYAFFENRIALLFEPKNFLSREKNMVTGS